MGSSGEKALGLLPPHRPQLGELAGAGPTPKANVTSCRLRAIYPHGLLPSQLSLLLLFFSFLTFVKLVEIEKRPDGRQILFLPHHLLPKVSGAQMMNGLSY